LKPWQRLATQPAATVPSLKIRVQNAFDRFNYLAGRCAELAGNVTEENEVCAFLPNFNLAHSILAHSIGNLSLNR
jgi:hypothetical protein